MLLAPITIIITTDIINTSWELSHLPASLLTSAHPGPGIRAETAAINSFGSGSKDTPYLT